MKPVITVIVVMLILAACGPRAPDEEQIRSRISEMTTALAERDARAFMSPIADDFAATHWDLDQRGARLLLNREMRAHQQLRARVIDIDVELQGQHRATATLHAVLTGGSGIIPDTGRWYRVDTGWRKEGSDWMLISARWESIVER